MSTAPADSEKKVRRRKTHKNSRFGCPQCKQRRVKCDETLPACRKCGSRGVRCGYLDYTPNEIETVRQSHLEVDGVPYLFPTYGLQNQLQRNVYPPMPEYLYNQQPTVHTHVPQQDQWSQMWPALPYQEHPHPYPLPQQMQPQTPNIHISHPQYRQQQQHDGHPQDEPTTIAFDTPKTDAIKSSESSFLRSTFTEIIESPMTSEVSSLTLSENSPAAAKVLHDIIYKPHSSTGSTKSRSPADSMGSPQEFIKSNASSPSDGISFPLISHSLNEPQYDPIKFPENFNETIPGVFIRLFLLKGAFKSLLEGLDDEEHFDIGLLFGSAILFSKIPKVEQLFIRRRGNMMRFVSEKIEQMDDTNAIQLMDITHTLQRTSIYMRNIPMKQHFLLSHGPGAILLKAFEDPASFPNSFPTLKITADGFFYTCRSMYYPPYDGEVLVEFTEIVKQFSSKFIENEDYLDSDSPLHESCRQLIEYLDEVLQFARSNRSERQVLLYPIKGVYDLIQHWTDIYPTMAHTVNSSMPGVEKVFYSLWHALTFVLEAIFCNFRYVFTFLFNGYYDLFIIPRDSLMQGLETDGELRWFANYSCRVIAFLMRRRQYVTRNTISNDPIPNFTGLEDRFKPRPIEIDEMCITKFAQTPIKPYHYPSEKHTAKTQLGGSAQAYYKGISDETAIEEDLFERFSGLQHDETKFEVVDLLDIDDRNSLLKNDFDPRFTDPIFNQHINFQDCDLLFVQKYVEDRKLIIQMDN